MKTANTYGHRVLKYGASSLAGFVLISSALSYCGYRLNSTPSVPVGLWKVDALSDSVQRGQIVSVQTPDTGCFQLAKSRGYIGAGPCAGGYASLLKPVAAIAGDSVIVSAQGIAVNGALLKNSNAMTRDGFGRSLTPTQNGRYIVRPGTVWLVSNCARSFDSRYFGAVPTANVLGTARPIWIGGTIQ